MLNLAELHFLFEDLHKFFNPNVNIMGASQRVQTTNMVQLMTVFQMKNVKSLEVWKKLEGVLEMSYY